MGKIQRYYNIIVSGIFTAYLFYIAASFFLSGPPHFFNRDAINSPIIQDDYVYHFVHAGEAVRFFKASGRLWAYSPYHQAGHITGSSDTVSNGWAALFMLFLGGIGNPALVFNLSIFFSYLILPVAAFFTARNFNFGKISTLFFIILSMLIATGFYKMADPADYYAYGMYSFPLAVFLSFWVASCFYRHLLTKAFPGILWFVILGSLTVFIHPVSAFILLLFCLPLVIFYADKITLKDGYRLIIFMAAILGVNILRMPFQALLSVISYIFKFNPEEYFQTDSARLWNTVINPRFLFLVILFLFSIYRSLKDKPRRFVLWLMSCWVLFFLVTFFGTQAHLSGIQPYRFIFALALLSVLVISRVSEGELKRKNFLFILALAVFACSMVTPPRTYVFGYQKYPQAGQILEFIKNNTSSGARIHIEDTSDDPYFKSHFIAYLSYYTSREVLAVSYATRSRLFTQFIDGNIFGSRLGSIPEKDLEAYIDLYNIKYFLVFSDEANRFFASNGKFKKVFAVDQYAIYEYLYAKESYCYQCEGRVKADYDKITVKGVTSGTTILKYHYLDTFRTIPQGLKIKPIKLLGDPDPFIMVENGDCRDFIIYNP